MKICKCGKEIFDFEEIKFGLCWECMSNDETIIVQNPEIGEIKEHELSDGVEKYSITIRDQSGNNKTFGAKKKIKEKKASTKSKIDDDVIPEENKEEDIGVETTKKGGEKQPPIVEDPEEMQLIKEIREIATTSARAKTRAFAIINQAIKETGVFDVVVMVEGKSLSVSSIPLKEGDIEHIKMTTNMEVTDMPNKKNKK